MNVREVDPAPLVVGAFMALAGGLFLAQPFVDPIPVGESEVPVVAFSFVALAVALDLGAVLFYWQGERTVALVHGVAGLGWTLLVLGPVLGSGVIWFLGLAVVIGGAVFLFAEMYRGRR
ncbi:MULTISPECIES: hypothetical protein [Salinibaculum]|uniref:hypothetical protein n=1 Tax=Salinibaculum TaxID=2732368 RepID=UPI0030CD8A56